jgi:hypothetical protein
MMGRNVIMTYPPDAGLFHLVVFGRAQTSVSLICLRINNLSFFQSLLEGYTDGVDVVSNI